MPVHSTFLFDLYWFWFYFCKYHVTVTRWGILLVRLRFPTCILQISSDERSLESDDWQPFWNERTSACEFAAYFPWTPVSLPVPDSAYKAPLRLSRVIDGFNVQGSKIWGLCCRLFCPFSPVISIDWIYSFKEIVKILGNSVWTYRLFSFSGNIFSLDYRK